MEIRGVLFDVDDTIFDYSNSAASGLLEHLAAEGILELFPSPADALALWRAIEDEEFARFLAGELTFAGQQLVRSRRFLEQVGRLPEDGVAEQEIALWFARYGERREASWAAYPDADPVLRKLASRFRLGVVSNSSLEHQRRKLRAVGLIDHFGEAIICSDEHGVAKPDAAIFLAGCAALGLPADQVAYVGDRYDVDAVGAHAAGLRAFWLDRAVSGVVPLDGITVITCLDELLIALIGDD